MCSLVKIERVLLLVYKGKECRFQEEGKKTCYLVDGYIYFLFVCRIHTLVDIVCRIHTLRHICMSYSYMN